MPEVERALRQARIKLSVEILPEVTNILEILRYPIMRPRLIEKRRLQGTWGANPASSALQSALDALDFGATC